MCSDAMDDCFEKSGLHPEDIEMLVVCTDTPEYLSPSNAIKVIGEYHTPMPNVKVAFDINANCTGMVMGVDMVSKYMAASNINNALVLGVFCVTPNALWDDTVVYATFADAAVCVALSSADDEGGFMDFESIVDACYHPYVTYPKCGMSKVALKSVQPNEKRLEWQSFDMDFLSVKWYEIISHILERNCLKANEIDYYIFSQLSDVYNVRTLDLLGIMPDEGKYHFVGTEYGYTGNTCPFVCLNRMWNKYAVKGNRVIICTVGAGYSAAALLYEF